MEGVKISLTETLSMADNLSTRQKAALAVALGTGVVLGAGGIIVYQRLSENVSLSVTGRDFSNELTTLSQSIDQLRKDIENLRGCGVKGGPGGDTPVLKSALKKYSNYTSNQLDPTAATSQEQQQASSCLELPPLMTMRQRSLSQSSSFTNGSSSTEYFSAISSDEEAAQQDIIQNMSFEEEENIGILNQVDELMEGREAQQQEALRLLHTHSQELGESPAYLWRLCKAQYLLAMLAGQADDFERKKNLVLAAIKSGEAALRLDESNSEAHKWYAIALGSRGEFGGVREKILDGFEFKKHIDKAAELNPRDYVTHHLLGRFCYEVSQLSWLERKMAATLFAEPPTATYDEAVQHFLSAEQMKPGGWKENRLFIAKCHIGLGAVVQAVEWLEKADSIPLAPESYREGINDRISQDEISKLLTKYKK